MSKSVKKAAPAKKKKGASSKKRRTPAQLANIARRGPLPQGEVKPHPYAGLYGNRNAVGNSGRPPAYVTPEEMQQQIDAYFIWIEGEKGEREIKYKDPKTKKEKTIKEEYWIRRPEPATLSGLTLYMGFFSYDCWETYEKKPTTEFPGVVARARLKITQTYEIALHDRDRVNGAKFALPNVSRGSWTNTQQVQPLGKDGKPTDPTPAAVIHVGSIADNLNKV